ncbi:unnamed protein product [Rhizoctonia solani]|uniref:Uncharacterized protein n=1 Tax=Rhizoctonia solani TaxID=456999 RepID=A0A8H3GKD8_9AGAM|nr:unnamed protein product [Rhizoctonia solani]
MPYNITVKNIYSMITYSGRWAEYASSSPNKDTMLNRYQNSSFHSSQTAGDSITIKFNGTAIYIYGAKRPNYGHYPVTIDGGKKERFDAYAPTQPGGDDGFFFQQVLFSRTNLENQLHEVVLTNDSGGGIIRRVIDIDYITWTSNGDLDTTIYVFDDSHPSWSYYGIWKSYLSYSWSAYNESSHSSQVSGSYTVFTFEGEAVYFYGRRWVDHGRFIVTLDNQELVMFDGFSQGLYDIGTPSASGAAPFIV